jgi:putative endonuclease
MTNPSKTLYTGVTSQLTVRAFQHQTADTSTFTGRYRIRTVVHVEVFNDVCDAITREKMIKGWSRAKKIALIEAENPRWNNILAADSD